MQNWASNIEQPAEIDALESHEWDFFDGNRRLEHQLVTVRDEKERREIRDVESPKEVSEAIVELAGWKEVLHVVQGRASEGRSAMLGAIKDRRARVQCEVATTSIMHRVLKGTLIAAVNNPKRHSSSVQEAGAAVQ